MVAIAVMTVACFAYTGQDGTILAAAAGAIGTVIGLILRGAVGAVRGTPGTQAPT